MTAAELDRLARAYLLLARTPGDPEVAELVDAHGPALAAEFVAASSGSTWEIDAAASLELGRRSELRLVVPGDAEWPAVELGAVGLWVSGRGRLGELTGRAVGMAGASTATTYGVRTAARMAGELARAGWTVVTVGRVGIDSAALRGAMQRADVSHIEARRAGAVAPPEVERPAGPVAPPLVLPMGRLVDPPPSWHADLFRWVRWNGLLVSEYGTRIPEEKTASDHYRQAELMAAVVRALVLIEPGWGSRWLVDAAEAVGVPVLAVPGSVDSDQSKGAHELIRGGRARLVTDTADVLADLDGGR